MFSKIIVTIVIGVQLGVSGGSPSTFLPTSTALYVAESVAKSEGYPLNDRSKYFFDIMLKKDNQPVFPGYVTVGFYWNDDIVNAISLDEKTGQVLEIDKCTLFDYPEVHKFQQNISQQTGVPALSIDALAKKVGCESLHRLSVPRKGL